MEVLEAKIGKGQTLKFNKRPHWEFWIRTIWNYLSDWAANAVIRWYNGKGGKGNYGWLLGEVLNLNPILLSPVLEWRTVWQTWRNLWWMDVDEMPHVGGKMRCGEWWVSLPKLLPITHLADFICLLGDCCLLACCWLRFIFSGSLLLG